MFTTGMSPLLGESFMVLTMIITVPTALLFLNWLGTMWRGAMRMATPMLFCVGLVFTFGLGGLTGLFLADIVADMYLHDSYFVVGHFHLIMAAALLMASFAAIYFWFPKMFGRMMSEPLGKAHFFLTFIGTYAIFMPMHYEGMAARPRRYSQLTEVAWLQHLMPVERFITYAAIITIAAQFIFVVNLFWSMFKGKPATDNPWNATTLEWSTATPPPHDNFGGVTPVVYHGPYEYSVPGAAHDFVMQTDPTPHSGHVPKEDKPLAAE
jgi:cytochrome c oxidase subunit 1